MSIHLARQPLSLLLYPINAYKSTLFYCDDNTVKQKQFFVQENKTE